jgi:predicted regulator of Ras-like GTPase activity (Roadblock/LC7/MglB family)
VSSPFAAILRGAIERTPGAVGGAFAASDGEMVDFIADDRFEWAVMTAHYGIVLAQVQAALHTFHHGEAEVVMIEHAHLDILMHAVSEGYYALIAVDHPAPLASAMAALEQAATRLREEMG